MSQENEHDLDLQGQEEQSKDEGTEDSDAKSTAKEEEVITLKKSDFKKLDRKARAYDAFSEADKDDKTEKPLTTQNSFDELSVVNVVSALKGLEDDEISVLESEAKDLNVPLMKFIKSKAGKTLLDGIRREKKSKEASDVPESKTPVFKKHTYEDLKKMSSAELSKILPTE